MIARFCRWWAARRQIRHVRRVAYATKRSVFDTLYNARTLPPVDPRIIPRVADPLDWPPFWSRRPGHLTPLADAMRQANEEMHKP